MSVSRSKSAIAIALAAILAASASTAAEPWPAHSVRIMTGTAAGGSADFVGRLLADKLAFRLGQTVVVETSANTGIAAWNAVAKSAPDGYTLGVLTGAFPARAALAKSLPFEPIRDFSFITLLSGYPMVVATAPTSPIGSFAELLERARAAPFMITYGMSLPGSIHHLTGELINVEGGISMRGIPYRSNSQVLQDLLGGRLDIIVETGTVAFAQIKGGILRGLAVSSPTRFPLEPDLPAIGETLPGFEVMSWLGLVGPAGTPRPIIDRLNQELRDILATPEVRERLAIVGNLPLASSPEEMQQFVERDIVRWARIIDLKGIERY